MLRLADWLVVGVAIALPWSTSATAICVAAWLIVLLPVVDVGALRREVASAAGGLPVLLWCLGLVGMLWADVDWSARLNGLQSFNRLLAIPFLLAQFRRSEHGDWPICGFLVSSTVLLLASYALVLTHRVTVPEKWVGIPVHDDISQNTEFLLCAFGLLGVAVDKVRNGRWPAALASLATAALFLANLPLVIFSRIAVVVAPILVMLFGGRFFGLRGVVGACVAAVVVGVAAWQAVPNVRERLDDTALEIREYLATNKATSIGMHTAFLKGSLSIIADAPVFGHGTGSIEQQFRRVAASESGAAAIVTDNPHNQTFTVAIELGLIGGVVLWAMWIAHLLLFRGNSIAAWFGLLVVVEDIVFSSVHSHLFDFTSGWLYVFGVGVLGGKVLRDRVVSIERR
jgi:hypothetical protein